MGFRIHHKLTAESAFTLLELMVTLGVVAVLTAVAIPTVSNYYKLARKVDCQASVTYFLRAQDMYYLDNNRFYAKNHQSVYKIGWNPANRPDQPEKYRFPELGVEFRPDTYRGYRIQVLDIDWGWLFWQELRLQLRTDEDFDPNMADPELYTYRKYNAQTTSGWGTSGRWVVLTNFWFNIPSAL